MSATPGQDSAADPNARERDQVLRFVIEDTPIRGQWVSLDASWRKCSENSEADPRARQMLGEALAAVTLLAQSLKIDGGQITLQIRGQGPVHLLVAQATRERSLRGLVRQSAELPAGDVDLERLFGATQIVLTIDQGQGEPHQGIVPLKGRRISDALQHYFETSEQLPTRLWLAADDHSAAGLLLQRLPGELEDEDAWNRIGKLADTVTDEELLRLPAMTLLHRLFHEEDLRLFDSEPLRFNCGCSRERIGRVIQSLGRDEAEDIIGEQGVIRVTCEFCNARHDFDAIDVAGLFEDATRSTPPTPTRH